jgi:hypothetical protein
MLAAFLNTETTTVSFFHKGGMDTAVKLRLKLCVIRGMKIETTLNYER